MILDAGIIGAAAAAGAASSLHCAAMCGPLVAGAGCRVRSTAGYHVGRLASYAFGGALAGAFGQTLVRGTATRSLRVGMALLAAALLAHRALVLLRPAEPKAPVVNVRRTGAPGVTSLLVSLLPRGGLGLGLVTGFLPCGALLTALLLAASSASAVVGAFAMVVFATASAPSLLLLAAAPGLLSRFRPVGPRIAAAGLLAAATWMAVRPLLVPACH